MAPITPKTPFGKRPGLFFKTRGFNPHGKIGSYAEHARPVESVDVAGAARTSVNPTDKTDPLKRPTEGNATMKLERPSPATLRPGYRPEDDPMNPETFYGIMESSKNPTVKIANPMAKRKFIPITEDLDKDQKSRSYEPTPITGFLDRFWTKHVTMARNRKEFEKLAKKREKLDAQRKASLRVLSKVSSDSPDEGSALYKMLLSPETKKAIAANKVVEKAAHDANRSGAKISEINNTMLDLDIAYAKLRAGMAAGEDKLSVKRLQKDTDKAIADELKAEGINVPRGLWHDVISPFMFGTKTRTTATSAVGLIAAASAGYAWLSSAQRASQDEQEAAKIKQRNDGLAQLWDATTNLTGSVNHNVALLRYVNDVKKAGETEFAQMSGSWANSYEAYTNGMTHLKAKMDSAIAPFVGTDMWKNLAEDVVADAAANAGKFNSPEFDVQYNAMFKDPASKLLSSEFYPETLHSQYLQAVDKAGGFRDSAGRVISVSSVVGGR